MVPKHIMPVVSSLSQYQLPKVSKCTIQLERDNIKDGYKMLEQPIDVFQTYLKQESMLRPDLHGKEAEVCTTCFHVYKYLEG